MDVAITQWINSLSNHSAVLDAAMVAFTSYGVPFLILIVIAQWWSRQDRLHVRHTCIAAGLSFLIGLGINQVILLFVHRVRPYDAGVSQLIIERSGDWSFPSDHATATFAIAAAFLLHGPKRRGLAFLAVALLVCFSRVYVGTHYFTDILGGAATGIIAAVAVRGLYREGTKVDNLLTAVL
ncbi:phosphatase PAP2 family protein [Roseibium aggregatum]|uniref:Phosphatase PAP2 family protein n=1 Tax=Roseibium aggregatum TaxID=187304 RepID=A0A926NXM6_9HYPH|nr:phosphatase PAP2 family protein [Roseibium aggregatum]MBD1545525.1 phosphatase PAP2 family protein [Roseibium aggregatum]